MSGDVQPRKRKDKRRRKDDEDAGTPPPTLINPSDNSTDNVSIHIYKESSTGGHWCARIIFFSLLAVLVGAIGVIIIEYRGTTDVDVPLASSRWVAMFDGWVDDATVSHDNEKSDEEDGDKVESEEHDDEESEKSMEESTEDVEDKEVDEDKEDDEGIGDEEEEPEDAGADGSHEEDESHESSILSEGRSKEEDEEEGDSNNDDNDEGIGEDDEEEEEESQEQFDDTGILEEVDNILESDKSNDEDEIVDEPENEYDVSSEMMLDSNEDDEKEMSQETVDMPGVNEIDGDSAEPLEEVEDELPEEEINDIEVDLENNETIEESPSVAVKFGVGVALVFAAHFVLIRRWNNVNADVSGVQFNETAPSLDRRNTIICPPTQIKSVLTSVDNSEPEPLAEHQKQTYEELRSKYNRLELEENMEKVLTDKRLRSQTEALATKDTWHTYSAKNKDMHARGPHKMTSSEEEEDGEEEYEGGELETSEGERVSGTEEYDEEEEEEEEEDEDEEIEDVYDAELVAKLEAKYGKLPTPQDTEDEEEEEEAEIDEEEVEEEEEERKEPNKRTIGWNRK